MSQRLWPPLTTVRQPTKKAAFTATLMLLDSLKTGDASPTSTELPTELVIRKSVGPRRKSSATPGRTQS